VRRDRPSLIGGVGRSDDYSVSGMPVDVMGFGNSGEVWFIQVGNSMAVTKSSKYSSFCVDDRHGGLMCNV